MTATTIHIHGGDFTKGIAWFYPGGFVLRAKNGRPESVPLSLVKIADIASEISLQVYGATEALRFDFECASESVSPGHRLFIVAFADGRVLLASADQTTFEQICTPTG